MSLHDSFTFLPNASEGSNFFPFQISAQSAFFVTECNLIAYIYNHRASVTWLWVNECFFIFSTVALPYDAQVCEIISDFSTDRLTDSKCWCNVAGFKP